MGGQMAALFSWCGGIV